MRIYAAYTEVAPSCKLCSSCALSVCVRALTAGSGFLTPAGMPTAVTDQTVVCLSGETEQVWGSEVTLVKSVISSPNRFCADS